MRFLPLAKHLGAGTTARAGCEALLLAHTVLAARYISCACAGQAGITHIVYPYEDGDPDDGNEYLRVQMLRCMCPLSLDTCCTNQAFAN